MNTLPPKKSPPKKRTTIATGVILLLTVSTVIIGTGFVVVALQGWMPAATYATTVAPAALTTAGAMIVALVLYYRWSRDHYQREILEDRRIEVDQKLESERLHRAQKIEVSRQDHADELERRRITYSEELERKRSREEYFRHRAQERGKRRESMGQRMVTAVEHISSTNGMTQSAGLIELGGLVDDWWAFGQEWLSDIDEHDIDSIDQIQAEVLRRRQELIDLIFKQRIPSLNVDNPDAELHRWTMVQETRARLLLNHDNNAHDTWQNLNLSHAYLKKCDLSRSDLNGFRLNRANFKNADLNEVQLCDAKLDHAIFDEATLHLTVCDRADMRHTSFNDATVLRASFVGSNLMSAKFNDSTLWADFTSSILYSADFRSISPIIVRFHGAKLAKNRDSLFYESSGAEFDTHYDASVEYDQDTIFPDDFDPELAGFRFIKDMDDDHP